MVSTSHLFSRRIEYISSRWRHNAVRDKRYFKDIFKGPSTGTLTSIYEYIANFFLETRYSLECDESIYDSVSDMCEGDLCCVTVSSHDELIDFIPGLASSMLAAWGTVKALGTFIAVYSDTVTLQEYVDTAELKEEVALLKEQVKLLTMKMDVTKTEVVAIDEEMAGRTINIETSNAEKEESMNKES